MVQLESVREVSARVPEKAKKLHRRHQKSTKLAPQAPKILKNGLQKSGFLAENFEPCPNNPPRLEIGIFPATVQTGGGIRNLGDTTVQ